MRLAAPLILLTGALIGFGAGSLRPSTRVAYVRSQNLLYGYSGMKEAMSSFQARNASWQANADTLRADLERGIAGLQQMETQGGNARSIQSERARLQTQQRDLIRYQESMERRAGEEENTMLKGVLNQVNTFVERYAQKHGYDLILGTTNEGSLLYADTRLDITDEILTALNAEYTGKR